MGESILDVDRVLEDNFFLKSRKKIIIIK